MLNTIKSGLAILTLVATVTSGAQAQQAPASDSKANTQFIGIDLDNGSVYYNGRNSGVYCLYRTVRVYNYNTGYFELHRARRCGRGLYLQ